MGVRARRWQLWLITTFILTGIIGMIQLFKGPESAGAVTIAGGAATSSVALPSRSASEQATQLPAWTPTDDATAQTAGNSSSENKSVPRVAAATTRPTVAAATGPVVATTSRTQATQLPSITVTTVTQTAAATKATSMVAKTVTTSAAPTTAKPTTTTPVATTTKAVTTTTAAKPTPTPVRTTTAAPTQSRYQPPTTRCYRILWWVRCR